MHLFDLVKDLDELFFKQLAIESDNAGLQLGKQRLQISKVLVTVDVADEVITEAQAEKAQLIFTHHPLIFTPLLNITEDSGAGSKIIRLVEHGIAVYAAHTNYDLMTGGLNDLIAEKIGLTDIEILDYTESEQWYKFVVFVPQNHETEIRDAICRSGGGAIGDYECCTFNTYGRGTFKPLEGAKPFTGDINELNFVDEARIECVVSQSSLAALLKAVLEVHPYEEPAYDIYRIENMINASGIGRTGRLEKPVSLRSFMDRLKESLELDNFKWMAQEDGAEKEKIENVVVVNGSANSAVQAILDPGFACDVAVVGELKYSNAVSLAEKGTTVVEIGHGESEKLAIDGIYDILAQNFKELEIVKSKTGFKPWRYYIE